MEEVVIGIATPPGMTAANGYFSAASALGFDRDENLRFKIFYGEEPGATARALCSGGCDIASLNTTVGLLGRQEGLPMKAIYGKARRTHRWFAVLPNSPIRSLGDLKGKRISCDFSHLQPLAEAALAAEGVNSQDYTWIPWNGSGMQTRAMLEPLRRGAVDAVFLIDWNDGDFTAEGLPLRRLPSKILDRIRLSSCLWVSESFIDSNPNTIIGTGRAVAKITVFGLEDPEKIVRLMWKQEPATRPASGDLDRILFRDLAIIKARLESFRIDRDDKDPRWGAIDIAEIDKWQDFMLASSAVSAKRDPASFCDTRFIDDFNRFDAEEVRVAAHQLKVDSTVGTLS
jgi:NitT/TauT family transport system substrate-binding protein